ncbi:hypothetical protein JK361_26065 [Streptomyces sp. 5-8]|uniref:Uncharacterized protein n=1 Tax=Streptomyces musisoli TaxID=2802280 RepID=A0ABS1P6K5_9ACTN|nr:hypothetical protein [Streptomyces musisoli]
MHRDATLRVLTGVRIEIGDVTVTLNSTDRRSTPPASCWQIHRDATVADAVRCG